MDDKNQYTVSVLIPAYNAGEYIARAIDSVLAQDHKADEIIVVDDGSTDNTASVVKKYGSQVRYIYQENSGAGAARNTAITSAKSEWIVFLDADDEMMPERLKSQISLLRNNKDLVWAFGNLIKCQCTSNERILAQNTNRVQKYLRNGCFDTYYNALIWGYYISTITVIVKRKVFEKAGTFCLTQFHGEEDVDMWFRIAHHWPRVGYVAEPLAIYHMGVSQTLSDKRRPLSVQYSWLDRIMEIADQHGRLTETKSCVGVLLKSVIRKMLRDKYYKDVPEIIARYDDLLKERYKTEMRLRARFPYIAPAAIDAYFWLKKRLRGH